MFHVITGGSGSGKSAFAEDCIVQLHKKHLEQNASDMELDEKIPLYYIATMMPFGKEMEEKIQRHRQMRAGKGFDTIECFMNLSEEAASFNGSLEETSLKETSVKFIIKPDVLLECMSNLVANEWFDFVQNCEKTSEDRTDSFKKGSCFSNENISLMIGKIWQGIQLLIVNCQNLVIVTNEVCSESVKDTIEMDCYKQILSGINCRMAAVADKVTEVVYGIPVQIKI